MIELLIEAESALSLGMLDRAEILYRQVAGADPRNSIAVLGLARVMLERGDEPGALNVARRALAIDPENTAAQRMTQRLEEVLRFREMEVAPRPSVPAPTSPVQPAHPEPAVAAPPPVAASRVSTHAPTGVPPSTESERPAHPAPAAPSEPPASRRPANADPVPQPGGPSAVPAPRSRSLIERLLRRR